MCFAKLMALLSDNKIKMFTVIKAVMKELTESICLSKPIKPCSIAHYAISVIELWNIGGWKGSLEMA